MNIEAEYHQEAMDLVESMVPDCTSVHHPTVIETHNSDDQVMSNFTGDGGALFSLIGWTFVTTWAVTKWVAPKVWKGCELAVEGIEWTLSNTR